MARKKSGGERIEPTFTASPNDAAPRVEAERAVAPSRRKALAARKKRKGSVLGRLFYWSFVLAIWGAIGAGGLFVYYGSQLPHIEQLAVPKRPPNIAVLGADGSLLANRGDTGGAAVRLQDLPPYLPKAFVAIEDRRFYSHWGVDPVGIFRARVPQRPGPWRGAGRLDPDPAIGEKPVPDPGTDVFAQDPGGDSGAVAGA